VTEARPRATVAGLSRRSLTDLSRDGETPGDTRLIEKIGRAGMSESYFDRRPAAASVGSAIFGSGIVLLLLSTAVTATAQTDDARKQAQALQAEGVRLLEKGDDRGALGKFDQAFQLVPSPKILFNRGKAHHALGEEVEALGDFERFLDEAPYAPKASRDEATRTVEALRPKLSYLDIETDDVGSEIAVDGHTVGTAPLPRPVAVAPGIHQVRWAKAGFKEETRSVAPIAGQKLRIVVKLVAAQGSTPIVAAPPAVSLPAPAASEPPGVPAEAAPTAGAPSAAPAPAPPTAERPWQITGAWIAAGAGVLFLGAGVTANLLSASKESDFNAVNNAPNRTNQCNRTLPNDGGPACQALADATHERLTLAIVGYAASGVAFAGSLILYLTAPSQPVPPRELSCAPAGGSGLWCALRLRF
jgi:hypothetical protein